MVDVRRKKVSGELDAPHAAPERSCKALDERRFGDAGHALEQHMTVRQKSDEHGVEHSIGANEDPRDFAADGLEPLACRRNFVDLGQLRHG